MKTNRQITNVQLENGNIVFSYMPWTYRKLLKNIWFDFSIIFGVIAMIAMLLLIIHYNNKTVTFVGIIIFFVIPLFTAAKCENIRNNKNEAIESDIIFDCLNPIIKTDINSLGNNVSEIERIYTVDDDDNRCARIHLSNGKSLIYNVINEKMYKTVRSLEIVRKYKIID